MGNVRPFFSWQGKDSTPPTNAEMVASSIALAEEAARLERDGLQRYRSAMGGSKACSDAASDVARARSDQRHWRGYAEYYRQQVAIELDTARARDVARAAEAARQAAMEIAAMPAIPPRMESGQHAIDADAWEDRPEERESAWADIGGVV
jgi:hypothetical protein